MTFEENFSDNSQDWFTSDDGALRASIGNEVYRLVFEPQTQIHAVIHNSSSFAIEQERFQMQALLAWQAGHGDGGYGLAWGIEDEQDYLEFVVSPRGEFRIVLWHFNQPEVIVPWTSSSAIYRGLALNLLEVRREGTDVYFFINSELVHLASATAVIQPCRGQHFGLALLGKVSADVHWLRISHPAAARQRREPREHDSKLEAEFQRHDPPKNDSLASVMADLQGLIGLVAVKNNFIELANLVQVQQLRQKHGLPRSPLSLHLVFSGAPGTGKTTLARLVGRLYRNLGLLEHGHVIETDRAGLLGGYTGQTVLKTAHAIEQALGGVLFIDEAHALHDDNYGSEVINVLVKRVEDHRHELALVMAGYPLPMQVLLSSNPGLRSRLTRTFDFPHYDGPTLWLLLRHFVSQAGYCFSTEAESALQTVLTTVAETASAQAAHQSAQRFGNGRFVRNLFERLMQHHANRLVTSLKSLAAADLLLLQQIVLDDVLALQNPTTKPGSEATTGVLSQQKSN
jgi:hypothetical protein